MKLREWILPTVQEEIELGSASPIPLNDLGKYIDEWESEDLNKESYEHYYVKKQQHDAP